MASALRMYLLTAFVLATAAPLTAEDCGPKGNCGSQCDADQCQACGRHCQCGKTCRLVPGTRKVSKTCYSCKCEDICIPNPSKYCGKTCEAEKDPCTGCVKCVKKEHWTPSPCGRIITQRSLVKKEVVKEVPAYKWEVVHLCPACQRSAEMKNRAVPKEMIVDDTIPADEVAGDVALASASEPMNAEAIDTKSAASEAAASARAPIARRAAVRRNRSNGN